MYSTTLYHSITNSMIMTAVDVVFQLQQVAISSVNKSPMMPSAPNLARIHVVDENNISFRWIFHLARRKNVDRSLAYCRVRGIV